MENWEDKYILYGIEFKCNNNCINCLLRDLKEVLTPISFEEFKNHVTDVAKSKRVNSIIFSGSEVTTSDELEKFVLFAKNLNYFKNIRIQTNGRKLANYKYCKKLIDNGVNEFFISVYGSKRRIHESMTKAKGSFDETIKGITTVKMLDRKVITNTVVTKKNYFDILEIAKKLSKLKIDEIQFWNYVPMNELDIYDLIVSYENIKPELNKVVEFINKEKTNIKFKLFPSCLFRENLNLIDHTKLELKLDEKYLIAEKKNKFFCPYRKECSAKSCLKLTSAYISKFGVEKRFINPISDTVIMNTYTEPNTIESYQELVQKDDIFLDYCRYEYNPAKNPVGKLKSENLLYESFRHTKCEYLIDIIRSIKEIFGKNKTIYGIKKEKDQLFWELYFYKYEMYADTNIKNILDILKNFFKIKVEFNKDINYLMFSIDLEKYDLIINELHIYMPSTTSIPGGPSYLVKDGRVERENYYHFFNPKEKNKIIEQIKKSNNFRISDDLINSILLPEYSDCYRICIAYKKDSDCIYYSRVKFNQFRLFLKNLEYPAELIRNVNENIDKYEYLLFDIGIDYKIKKGDFEIKKSGFYGYF